MKLKEFFLGEKEKNSSIYLTMCKYPYIAQDYDGDIRGFYEKPKLNNLGVWGDGSAQRPSRICFRPKFKDYDKYLFNDWVELDIFPQVGVKVKVWYESDFNNWDLDKEYLPGVVVYSGEKGVTVDVGFLYSTSEKGDLIKYDPNAEIVEFIYKELPQNYFQNDRMRKSIAEHLSTLYTEGKFPEVIKDDE